MANTAQNKQYKRNKVVVSSQHPMQQGIWNGIDKTCVVAVTYDSKAPVYNYNGEVASIDADDGSAFVNPFQDILENNSLGSQAVGHNKKSIWHTLNSENGTAFLGKMATYALTNSKMRLTLNSVKSDFRMFKKMSNIQWSKNHGYNISFEGKFYYKDPALDRLVEVDGLNVDENTGMYYTIENNARIYHVFDNESVHHKFSSKEDAINFINENQGAHTINSLYELHTVFGGIFSCDGNGNFNEDSVKNTVDIICKNPELKQKFVAYNFNLSAVKNGTKNVNTASRWINDEPLNTFQLSTDGLGVQLNSDHDVTDSELTEFTQVISACSFYGFTEKLSSNMYKALANNISVNSKSLIEVTEEVVNVLINENNLKNITEEQKREILSNIYSNIGSIILTSGSLSSIKENIANVVAQAVKASFDKYIDHTNDEFKFPFSDNSVYTSFIAALTSSINKIIKRKYPGSGYVINPSYNRIQYYEVQDENGNTNKMMPEDVLREARKEMLNPNEGHKYREVSRINDNMIKAQTMINIYLKSKNESGSNKSHDISYFVPSDIIDVYEKDKKGKLKLIETINIDNLDTYYDVKEKYNSSNYEIKINRTRPRNLKPAIVRFKILDGNGNFLRYGNLFDLDAIKNNYESKKRGEGGIKHKKIQDALMKLVREGKVDIDGVEYSIDRESIENYAAEAVIGNPFANTFGTGDQSMYEIAKQGEEFFKNQYENIKLPEGQNYDIAFLNRDGRHVLVKMGNTNDSNETINIKFNNEVIMDNGLIVDRKYNGDYLVIGKITEDTNVKYDEDTKSFKHNDGLPLNQNDYIVRNNTVYKKNYVVKKQTKDKMAFGGKKTRTNVVYKIASTEEYMKLFGIEEDAVYEEISKVLSYIYELNRDSIIQQNKDTNLINNKIYDVLLRFMQDPSLNKNIKNFIEFQYNNRNNVDLINEEKNNLIDKLAHEQYISFLDSSKVISSRIPAQSFQSFMGMNVIGWTGDSNNEAFVSYFQTYLQGSDYDIDKAYIMMSIFDSLSSYKKWSNFFDFTTLKTLQESKKLPLPEGIKVEPSKDGITLPDSYVSLLMSNSQIDKNNQLVPKEDEHSRINFLRALKGIIEYVHDQNTSSVKINTNNESIIKLINMYEMYKMNEKDEGDALKNIASSSIYEISTSIENADQSYTPISLSDLERAADESPKGLETVDMSLLNPYTKYNIQFQGQQGANNVGIAANGQKFWANYFQYVNTKIKKGEIADVVLRMKTTRINGRYERNESFIENESTENKIIPDLNTYDEGIRDAVCKALGITSEELSNNYEYKYVDQILSQFIPAATDNAKVMILPRINASPYMSKAFVCLLINGYDIKDICAFMTSPCVELISNINGTNIYKGKTYDNTKQIINVMSGKFDDKKIDIKIKNDKKLTITLGECYDIFLEKSEKEKPEYINYLKSFVDGVYGINKAYLEIFTKMLETMNNTGDFGIREDAKDLAYIYAQVEEISNITSAILGLNQGVPTSQVDTFKKLRGINRIVKNQEDFLDIDEKTGEDTIFEIIKERKYNGKELSEDEENRIRNIIKAAKEADIIGKFDIYKYFIADEKTKKIYKDYAGVVSNTVNFIDMIENIPLYKEIFNVFKSSVIINISSSVKSKLINDIINNNKNMYLDKKKMSSIVSYADQLVVLKSVENLPYIRLKNYKFNGFDEKFNNAEIDTIRFDSLSGCANFIKFVEVELYSYLKEKYPDNGFVKNMTKDNGIETRIDLLEPEKTNSSKKIYQEILSGMEYFYEEKFEHQENTGENSYTIGDLLLLYNVLKNLNKYGADRLTSIFRNFGQHPKSKIYEYFANMGEIDYNKERIDYNNRYLLISIAPTVNEGSERYRNEEYIKVKEFSEDGRGHVTNIVLKRRVKYGKYEAVNFLEKSNFQDDNGEQREANFLRYAPFTLPGALNKSRLLSCIKNNKKDELVGILKHKVFNNTMSLYKTINDEGKVVLRVKTKEKHYEIDMEEKLEDSLYDFLAEKLIEQYEENDMRLIDALNSFNEITKKEGDENEGIYESNITIDELFKEFPLLGDEKKKQIKEIVNNSKNSYTIIFNNNKSGKVLLSNGDSVFYVKKDAQYSIEQFFDYVIAKNYIENNKGGIKKFNEYKEEENAYEIICKEAKVKNISEVLEKYLDDNKTVNEKTVKLKDGSTVVQSVLLDKLIRRVLKNNEILTYSDLELSLYRICDSKTSKGVETWEFKTIKDVDLFLNIIFNEKKELIDNIKSIENAENIKKELDEELNGINGLFYVHAKLYGSEIEVNKNEKGKLSISIKFNKNTIGEKYNFGYSSTETVFEKYKKDRYKGFFIYEYYNKANEKTMYAISQHNEISPNSYVETFNSVDAAIKNIDNKYNKKSLSQLALFDMHLGLIGNDDIVTVSSGYNINPFQIISYLDISENDLKHHAKPEKLLELTPSSFINEFNNIYGEQLKISNPAKLCLFIMKLYKNVQNKFDFDKKTPIEQIKDLINENKDTIEQTINEVNKIKYRSTYVKKVEEKGSYKTIVVSKNQYDSKQNKDSQLKTSVSAYIGNTLSKAANYFNETYGINVKICTISELENDEFLKKNNITVENLKNKKAFIFNNTIYINSTKATASDLHHEATHIFLGMLKVQDYDAYLNFINNAVKDPYIKRKIKQYKDVYKGWANQDILEEIAVDKTVEEIANGGNNEASGIIKNIIKKINTYSGVEADNGLRFDKDYYDNNKKEITSNRIIANHIRDQINKEEIKEICK